MYKRRKILVFAGAGIRGTEKCATLFASELQARGHTVGFVSHPGPRLHSLTEQGIQIITPQDNPAALADSIRSFGAEILHQHVPGYAHENSLYEAIDLLGDYDIKLIETNVFGRLEDSESWRRVDFRMFISSTSGVQAFRRAGLILSDQMLRRHAVVNYPVISKNAQNDAAESAKIRRELGVESDEILFFRTGHPSHKWTMWEYEAFKQIKNKIPNARLLLMEPSEEIWKVIEPYAAEQGIILRRVSADFLWIEGLNRAGDIAIHASAWGESFGYSLAEAMSSGCPVITRSTPWGDNAQVELVENGKTGFVCLSVGEMARGGIRLAQDTALREKMGMAGKLRISKISDLKYETDVLEAVINDLMKGGSDSVLESRNEEFKLFAKTFRKRELTFSESLWNHPLEKIGALFFMAYKCGRGYARNVRERIKYN